MFSLQIIYPFSSCTQKHRNILDDSVLNLLVTTYIYPIKYGVGGQLTHSSH